MIVCSCNVLTDRHIRTVLDTEMASRPRTPGQVYKCMGCQPKCGRCLPTIQRIMSDHSHGACTAGCAACPAQIATTSDNDETIYAIAAE